MAARKTTEDKNPTTSAGKIDKAKEELLSHRNTLLTEASMILATKKKIAREAFTAAENYRRAEDALNEFDEVLVDCGLFSPAELRKQLAELDEEAHE